MAVRIECTASARIAAGSRTIFDVPLCLSVQCSRASYDGKSGPVHARMLSRQTTALTSSRCSGQ